jgi:hypothetical protein
VAGIHKDSCSAVNVFLALGREPSGIANGCKHRRARALPLKKSARCCLEGEVTLL